jgi:translation elongation factor EF-1alpha
MGPYELTVTSIQTQTGIDVNMATAGEDVGVTLLRVHNTHAITSSIPKPTVGGGGKKLKPNHKQKKVKDNIDPLHSCKRGMVMCIANQFPCNTFLKFEAQLMLLKGSNYLRGRTPTLTIHLDTVNMKLVDILEIIGKNNVTIEKNPTEVKPKQTCICIFEATRVISAETIHDYPRLSRFFIREDRSVVAVGFIKKKLA